MKNEPAFPCETITEDQKPWEANLHPGMSKRYWTAVMIAQGYLSGVMGNKEMSIRANEEAAEDKKKLGKLIAEQSFVMADYLIKQENE